MKKIISLIIAVAMIMTALPMTMASAAEPTEISYWETKVSNMEVENIAVGKTFVAANDKKELIRDGSKAVDGKVQHSAGSTAIYLRTDLVFARLDLGAVNDIQGIGLYRMDHDYPALPEVTFYGSNEELTAKADLETKAVLLGTIAEDTTAGDTSTQTTRSSGALAAPANSNYRYIYMTTTKCGSHVNELYVYSKIEDAMTEVMTGLVGVDDNGKDVTVFTDGTTKTSQELKNNVKYDLGAEYDLKWLSFSANSLYNTYWHQNEMRIKASVTDDFETATEIMSTGWPSVSQGRKVHVSGTYRYIWVCGSNNTHFSSLRVYGYPAFATTVQVDPRDYTNTIEWYSDAACENAIVAVDVLKDSTAWTPAAGVWNYVHSYVKDGKVSTDGVLAIGAYTKTEAPTLEIPVPKITADGWYDVSYFAGGYHSTSSRTAPIKITMKKGADGEEIPVSEHVPGTRSATGAKRVVSLGNNYGLWSVGGEKVYLEKGSDYTMYITLYSAYSSATNQTNTLLSRITLTPSSVETVSPDAKTTLEYEDYVEFSAEENAQASGDGIIVEHTGTLGKKTTSLNPYDILMPIKVTEAGNYDISAVIGSHTGSSYPITRVYVDGEEIITNEQAGEDSGIDTFTATVTFDIDKYTKERVYLTEGVHTIKTSTSYRATTEANTIYTAYAADCVTIEKSAPLTSYTIQPYAPSNIDEIDWYTDSTLTTPIAKKDISISSVTKTDNPSTGIYQITHANLAKRGFGDNFLSIQNLYTENSSATYTLDDTLKIEATDYYKLSYAIGGTTGYTFSGISVELEDVNDSTKKNVITRYVPEINSNVNKMANSHWGAINNQCIYDNDYNEITEIEEGEYKVHITVYKSAQTKLTLSDIHLDATDPVDVPAGVKTTLEVEDYTHYGMGKNLAEGGVADVSDNGIAWATYGNPRGNVPVLINIPINVEAEDDYTLETHMAKAGVGNTYIYVDGEQVVHSGTGGTLTGKTITSTSVPYSMAIYQEKLHLTPGEHMITVSGTVTGTDLRFAVDYVSLEKYYENPISQSATTRIEMEDYAEEFAAAYGETEYESLLEEAYDYHYTNLRTKPVAMVRFDDAGKNFSNLKAMYGVKETEDAKVIEIPVTIKDAGYYNAKYRVGGTSAIQNFAWFDTELVADDGTAYSLSEAIYRESEDAEANATQTRINDGYGSHTWQLTSSPAYVPAGSYTMKMTITGTTFLCDYIDIMPVEVVDATEGIDFEVMKVKAHKAEGIANGNSIEYSDWSFTDKQVETYTYPITVAAKGYYDVEAAMNTSDGISTSNIKLMIDDVVVYNNAKTGEDLSDSNKDGEVDYVSNSFRINKYTGNKIYLEAGDHELQVQTTKTSEEVQYVHKFAIDYVKLIKTEDRMYFGTETEEDPDDEDFLYIETSYGKPVSGDAYMVFYNDGKLVDFSKAGGVSENNPIAIVAAIPPKEEYDYIKLLVWEHCDPGKNMTLKPCAIAIGFAK